MTSMCLAVPGKVLEINKSVDPVMAKVSFGGIEKQICLDWLPEVTVGDYVLVHVGFAISKLDEGEAMKTLQLLDELENAGDGNNGSEVRDDRERQSSVE